MSPVAETAGRRGGANLGPGDVPLGDRDIRTHLLNDLGAEGDFDPVITADIAGPSARARKIDDRLARDTPALASVRPATRLATIILLCSFGGLKRDSKESNEPLPPGITEDDLLTACVTPELDSITATAVLGELRNACLYLHYDGSRYCFKKDPNVTKLIEDAEQAVAREEAKSKGSGPVRERIKDMLEARLAKQSAEVWPAASQDIPDNDPTFVVAYLPLEFAAEARGEQERQALDYLYQYGSRPRNYRNGIGLAVPEKKAVDSLRRAVRYLLAVERVKGQKVQHRLTSDQLDQLEERRRNEGGAAESALRDLYLSVWLPRMEKTGPGIEKVEKGGRPLQATSIHERIMELLTSQGSPKIHTTVTPRKLSERLKLGEPPSAGDLPRLGVRAKDVEEAFFAVLDPPRLTSADALRSAIVRGVAERLFGYTSGDAPKLGADGKYEVSRDRVRFGATLTDDEVDFETGFLIAPVALPAEPPEVRVPPPDDIKLPDGGMGDNDVDGTDGADGDILSGKRTRLTLEFSATRAQLYKAFPALGNLAEKSDGQVVTVRVQATAAAGFDPSWLRNAVEEPLDEADIKPTNG